MNEEQYRQLCEACDSVLLSPKATKATVAIPWLHVIREHPTFLEKYQALFLARAPWFDFLSILAKNIKGLCGWLRQLIRASLSAAHSWESSQALSAPSDVLFVSHLLNDTSAGCRSDFYFGTLPEVLQDHGLKVVVALLDHSAKPVPSRVKLWNKEACPRALFTHVIDLKAEWSMFSQVINESARLRKSARQVDSPFARKVLRRAATEALSGSTRETLRISTQISKLIDAVKPKTIIVTYEGHAWERVSFFSARQNYQSVMCVGYQHAAIFRLQHSIMRALAKAFNPDVILTAGLVSKKQLQKKFDDQKIPIGILGSNRAVNRKLTTIIKRANRTSEGKEKSDPQHREICLVLPEGITSECFILTDFCIRCAELIPEMKFVLRLHPLVNLKELERTIPSLNRLPANVEISENALEIDLKQATYALYRGSTAIVPAVILGVRPVYLDRLGEMTIDPLHEVAVHRTSVLTPTEFMENVIGSGVLPHSSLENTQDILDYCKDFYSSFEPTVLLSLLQDGKLQKEKHLITPDKYNF